MAHLLGLQQQLLVKTEQMAELTERHEKQLVEIELSRMKERTALLEQVQRANAESEVVVAPEKDTTALEKPVTAVMPVWILVNLFRSALLMKT